ncbi:MAG: DUF58 domain-containing protein [Pseudomonadota bacterium]
MAPPASSAPTDRSSQAASLAARFHGLSVSALRVAATVAQGTHGRRRSGIGNAFWQFRHYQAGDAVSAIDWRQTAKRGKAFVRETEWEAAQTVWLWRDGSPGLDYASAPSLPTKKERAEIILLAMASLLASGGEQVGLLGIDRRGRPNERDIAALAERLDLGTDASVRLPQLRGRLSPHAEVILISDFLCPFDELTAFLNEVEGRRLRCHLIQILDPAEFDLPFEGRVRFTGFYNEGETLIPKVATVRQDYHDRLTALRESLAERARRSGWTYIEHRTDHSPHTAVMALYQALSAPIGLAAGGGIA